MADDNEHLDRLDREELRETDATAYTLATVLDEWKHREHGIISASHGAGLFLDLLAAEGLRIAPVSEDPATTTVVVNAHGSTVSEADLANAVRRGIGGRWRHH